MPKLNDRELASIKLDCLKKALQIHTMGIRSKKDDDTDKVIKTAKKFEEYVTK